jgi:hypothetical protein
MRILPERVFVGNASGVAVEVRYVAAIPDHDPGDEDDGFLFRWILKPMRGVLSFYPRTWFEERLAILVAWIVVRLRGRLATVERRRARLERELRFFG